MVAFKLDTFKRWLVSHGAIIEAPTNEWELLRVATCDGTFIAYRNKKGVETWPDGLMAIRDAFLASRDISLSPDLKARKRLRHTIDEIAGRDGLWCFFCEIGFLSPDSNEITIEHLVPHSLGGPNHIANLVISCEPCNRAVGNMSVAEKARFRDEKRAA
jgi:hypothetical protein